MAPSDRNDNGEHGDKATNEYNNDATENNNLDEANAEAEGTGDHVTRIPGGQPAASIADAASTILPSSKSMSSALGSWGGHKSGLGFSPVPSFLEKSFTDFFRKHPAATDKDDTSLPDNGTFSSSLTSSSGDTLAAVRNARGSVTRGGHRGKMRGGGGEGSGGGQKKDSKFHGWPVAPSNQGG